MTNKTIIIIFIVSFILAFFVIGCAKKPDESNSNQELTPLNAPEQYAGVASRAMKKASAMGPILFLNNKTETFHIKEGTYPDSLQELVDKGFIKPEEMPKPPEGMQFIYNKETGKVDVK